MLAHIYWNPQREIFTLPFVNHPIVWYGVLFALGFFIAYFISLSHLRHFYKKEPFFHFEDILDWKLLLSLIRERRKTALIHRFLSTLAEPFREKILSLKEDKLFEDGMKKSILYGLNHFIKKEGYKNRKAVEEMLAPSVVSLDRMMAQIGEKLFYVVVIASVIGARLGHLIFYENPSYYLAHPIRILKTWEGGLASHGAILGLILGVAFFRYRIKKRDPYLTFLKVFDICAAGGVLAGAFIRVGNFINQEILGKPSELPWAVIFGSPADGGAVLPRHPAQLYEALAYMIIFLLLWFLHKKGLCEKSGQRIGLCIFTVFTSRFFIEFLKEKQSVYDNHILSMGQLLSIPLIILGLLAFFSDDIKKGKLLSSFFRRKQLL